MRRRAARGAPAAAVGRSAVGDAGTEYPMPFLGILDAAGGGKQLHDLPMPLARPITTSSAANRR
ncbi:hypothetical protein ABZT04_44770 [Streptomyces sp. NPDC005492]|uniref:hypothetical protein n=1 Tax=Streptomyces sp. NPDC005492 TaxID=3156883 RepID=UPI0033AB455E